MNHYRMAPDEIGEVLNKQGHGQCPWCATGSGLMVVGEFGVRFQCGHARRLPPLHATQKTTLQCQICTPRTALRLIAA
jgi:hypothetical protein